MKKIGHPSSIKMKIEIRKSKGERSINKTIAKILLNILTERFKCF